MPALNSNENDEPSSSPTTRVIDESIITPPPQLPLGWTKIRRRRKRTRNNFENDETTSNSYDDMAADDECCNDPNCTTLLVLDPKNIVPPLKKSSTTNNIKNMNPESIPLLTTTKQYITLEGTGIFCLPEIDCTWFQGHFLSTTTQSSFQKARLGMLVIERDDLDDCLKCQDNGYREVDLTLLGPSSSSSTSHGSKNDEKDDYLEDNQTLSSKSSSPSSSSTLKRKKFTFSKLSCTGGDMLTLSSRSSSNDTEYNNSSFQQNTLQFTAETVITGPKVESYFNRYFSNLLSSTTTTTTTTTTTLTSDVNDESTDKVLNVYPDCAIIIGNMTMTIPSNFLKGRADNDDDDKHYNSTRF